MEATPVYAVQPRLDFSSVFKRSFSTLLQHPLLFLLLAAVASLPTLLPLAFMARNVAAISILIIALKLGSMGAICHAACQCLKGDNVSFMESLSTGFVRLIPLFAALVLPILPIIFGAVILSIALRSLGPALMFIPAIVFFCMLIVITPVCVWERLGPIAAIKRSAALTKGNRWVIFFIFLVLFLCTMALNTLVTVAVGGSVIDFGIGGPLDTPSFTGLSIVANFIVSLPTTAIFNTMIAVVYHDLSSSSQGSTGLEAAARVFD